MEAGDWATWVGSASAVVAAVASVAVWRQSRPGVSWRLDGPAERGRHLVVNAGGKTARDVIVRSGHLERPDERDWVEQAKAVAPGETIPIMITPHMANIDGYGVDVTWRGRFGRRERWVRRTH